MTENGEKLVAVEVPKRRRTMICPKCEGKGKVPTPKKPRPRSRADRWADAATRASEAVQELVDLQSDFQSWLDNLPENLQQSSLGEKLQTICELDIDGAMQTISEAEDAEVPLGYGRD